MPPLRGVRVLTLALNVPGPVAVARLAGLGAAVRKIEPPGGDPLQTFAPAWFDRLHTSVARETVDLKSGRGRAALDLALADADVLITSQRPSALDRMGLGLERLGTVVPALHVVRIVGDLEAPEQPGHDLTYQAETGLIEGRLPATLLADLVGAEQTVAAVLVVLRQAPGSRQDVGLRQALDALTPPLTYGLTTPGGPLGGGLPAYGVYVTADGQVAIAALEPRFRTRLYAVVGLPLDAPIGEAISARTTAEWLALAREHDLPISRVTRR